MSQPKYAVALVRSSNSETSGQDLTIAEQQEEMVDYAKTSQIEIQKIFTSSDRSSQVIKEIISYCKANPQIGYLLIEKPSRLSRSIIEYNRYLGAFYACGVEVLTTIEYAYGIDSIEDTYQDYLSMAMVEIDSRMRSEQVKRALLNRTKAGYSVSRPPLGYAQSRIRGLYEKTNTASALCMYFQDTLAGVMTIQELRQKISHIYYPKDRLISLHKLRNIVSNPYYAGFVSYQGQQFRGLHEPLLTSEQQQELIELLSN